MKELITIGGRDYVPATNVEERFGIAYSSLYIWIENGTLPRPLKPDRRLYFDRDEVLETEACQPEVESKFPPLKRVETNFDATRCSARIAYFGDPRDHRRERGTEISNPNGTSYHSGKRKEQRAVTSQAAGR